MSCSRMARLRCHGDLRLHASNKVHLLVEAHLIDGLSLTVERSMLSMFR